MPEGFMSTTFFEKEICRYMQRRHTLTYSPEDETLVTVGGSEAIDLAIRACVCAGDFHLQEPENSRLYPYISS